jgi:hypothetical protein
MPSLFSGESMNAKMVVSIPVENIPKEVKRMLSDVNSELLDVLTDTKTVINSDDHLFMINKIDALRKELNRIDMKYDDCYNVLVGYVKYKSEQLNSTTGKQENNNELPPTQ